MACRLEINATYAASQEPEKWGYKGGPIECPKRGSCGGKCSFSDENFRTIDIDQGLAMEPPTQTQKLRGRIEKYFEKKGSIGSRRG